MDDRTLDSTVKKGGKAIDTVRIVVSADGKSHTVIVSGTTPKVKSLKTSLFTTSSSHDGPSQSSRSVINTHEQAGDFKDWQAFTRKNKKPSR